MFKLLKLVLLLLQWRINLEVLDLNVVSAPVATGGIAAKKKKTHLFSQ